ncbi:MAG: glycine cleavage system protein H [Candidatus Kryptoniota bacterium]
MKHDKTISRVVPDGEMNCIWVDAGLVSYKLCDLSFDCENCRFDQVMRQRPQPLSNSTESRRARPLDRKSVIPIARMTDKGHDTLSPTWGSFANLISEFLTPPTLTTLPEDRLYSDNHVWAKEVGKNRYRVGMDHYAVAFLSPPLSESFGEEGGAIVLPEEGSVSVRDTPFAWLILDDETVAVRSPMNGKISKINSQLKNFPSLIREDPYNSGWVSEVEVRKQDVVKKIFLHSKAAKTLYDEQINKMERTLADPDKVSIGVTMMDGGMRYKSLKNILGSKEYVALLKELLSVRN